MLLYLVHHGDAVSSEADPQRPLSARGCDAVAQLAGQAAARGVCPDAIWHSGKLRARQTAEAFWRACNPLATFSAERGLQPDDPPHPARGRLIAEPGAIMVVGHMPHLARLLNLLVTGSPDGGVTFPAHGMVALERAENRWEERWRI